MITTPAMTAAGIILGTAAYMSPEQAKGKPADKRSDIWAFGCVLYEMLTGTRPFPGEDVAEVLAAVLTNEPDWRRCRPTVPQPLRSCCDAVCRRSRQRIGDVQDVRLALEGAFEPDTTSVRPPHRRRRCGAGPPLQRQWQWLPARESAPPCGSPRARRRGHTVCAVTTGAAACRLMRPGT